MTEDEPNIFATPEFLQLKRKLQADLTAYLQSKGTTLKSMSLVTIAEAQLDANAYHAGCLCHACALNHLEVMDALADKIIADVKKVPHGVPIQ